MDGSQARTRREVLTYTTAATALALAGCARRAAGSAPVAAEALPTTPESAGATPDGEVPRRKLGKTGATVSALGIGGSHLAETKDPSEAIRIVHEAIEAGVTFFDNAWEYHDGRSEEILGKALADRRDRVFLMTKVCTHGRDAKVAMQQLDDSLRRLGTDHLDLWQVHECVYWNDPERHYANDGVLRALDEAKRQGKVRFVGFTGHKDPAIHLKMLELGYPFDTCQLPLNAFDARYRSFEQRVLPELARRQIAPIGMKSLCGSGAPVRAGIVGAEEAIRYAMSLPVATTVTGIDSLDILRQNLAIARGFTPLSREAMDALRARLATEGEDGHHELYKTTMHFDAKVGREQHGFPSAEELPL